MMEVAKWLNDQKDNQFDLVGEKLTMMEPIS
jgi:hypothetical protein